MNKKKIIDKVVKLLALAENNSETMEAKSAKNMAAKLMADHNIATAEAETSKYSEFRAQLNRKAQIKYDSLLISNVSRFNDVVYIKDQTGQKAVNIFVGSESDIECNNYMLDIVLQQRTTCWNNHRDCYKLAYEVLPKGSEKDKWMKGFAFGVADKLKELTGIRDSYITEKGLVPVNVHDQILNDYREDNNIHSTKGRSLKYSAMGRSAGRKTAIHKGVEQQTSTRMLR